MIIGVAIKQGDLCICLPKPNRHHDVIRYAFDVLGIEPPIGNTKDSQGFYLADGTFMNRQQAMIHAQKNGQLIRESKNSNLFSEDLW